MSLKKLDNLLNSKGVVPLEQLVHRAQDMDRLAAALRRALPETDVDAIVAANVRDDGELVVICRSSTWASLLRFKTDRLVDAARRHGIAVSRCSVRVGR